VRGGKGVRVDPIVASLEFRSDRPYDEQSPGHVHLPNGTTADSQDREFLGAAAREALILHGYPVGQPLVDTHEGSDAA
jgi:hypothetical protein